MLGDDQAYCCGCAPQHAATVLKSCLAAVEGDLPWRTVLTAESASLEVVRWVTPPLLTVRRMTWVGAGSACRMPPTLLMLFAATHAPHTPSTPTKQGRAAAPTAFALIHLLH